jgi:hypothetical protein
MDELVDILWAVTEEGCHLAYTPGTMFMFEFVIWVHIFPFLYRRVRFLSAARNLLVQFASSRIDTAADATTRHSDEQETTICEFGDLAAVLIKAAITNSIGRGRPARTNNRTTPTAGLVDDKMLKEND